MECMRDSFVEGALLDGRFEAVAPLNHGSFGMVFVAKDTTTGDTVAVKCLTKSAVAGACPSALAVDDRSEELACHARLGAHPNIVNVVHHFETDAHLFIVLEFCAMGDLYEAIRLGRGPRETDNVRDFMLQLVGAVEHMHAKGMYHRDIKPENIFLTPSGDMKLGDFGLATVQPWSHESGVGSDRYMAPEQYDSAAVGGYATDKADVWAVGICLLNLLFSRNPFVTPTESDPLFADYVRDRQSLFDIFPTMSQDTYEVLAHALAIDPAKRSLSAMREALARVVSFTTDDESLDDFCTEDHDLVPATANREPLRTPSIQSPHIEQAGTFPWAKALRASPQQQVRQLSAIPDTEDYTEDVKEDDSDSDDLFSLAPETMSIASVLDSGLGASLKSMAIRRPAGRQLPRSDPVPISGSMPIVGRAPAAMASVFGDGKDVVSKSWSDLWDEDEEESVAEGIVIQTDGTDDDMSSSPEDVTMRLGGLREVTSSSTLNIKTRSVDEAASAAKLNDDMQEDVFFFEEQQPPRYSPPPPRYTPPSRRDIMDKWAALGDRRRAYNARTAGAGVVRRSVLKGAGAARGVGLGFSVYEAGVWEGKGGADVPWAAATADQRDRDMGGAEWVGGWHDLQL